MEYTNDTTYKQHLQTIEKDIQEMTTLLQQDATKAKEQAEKTLQAGNTLLQEKWHHLMHTYHDTLSYLKERFNIAQDDILAHKIQSVKHKAQEAGYALQQDD